MDEMIGSNVKCLYIQFNIYSTSSYFDLRIRLNNISMEEKFHATRSGMRIECKYEAREFGIVH